MVEIWSPLLLHIFSKTAQIMANPVLQTKLHQTFAAQNEEILNGKLHFLCSPSYLFEWMAILIWDYHCVKSVFIQSYSGPYFPAFGLNTERYGVSLRIQSECGKIRTRITPNTDTFHAVHYLNVYLEPSHISKMDAFAEIVHGWKLKASNYFCKKLHLKPLLSLCQEES